MSEIEFTEEEAPRITEAIMAWVFWHHSHTSEQMIHAWVDTHTKKEPRCPVCNEVMTVVYESMGWVGYCFENHEDRCCFYRTKSYPNSRQELLDAISS